MDLRQLTHDVEIISQRYAEHVNFTRDDAWFLLKLQEEVGELTQAYLMRNGQARTKGQTQAEIEANFRAEFADVLCQLLLMANHHGIDVATEVDQKWLHRLRK
jgi:NTP pyrophosphatase (non-canonical NTP hydrolase)